MFAGWAPKNRSVTDLDGRKLRYIDQRNVHANPTDHGDPATTKQDGTGVRKAPVVAVGVANPQYCHAGWTLGNKCLAVTNRAPSRQFAHLDHGCAQLHRSSELFCTQTGARGHAVEKQAGPDHIEVALRKRPSRGAVGQMRDHTRPTLAHQSHRLPERLQLAPAKVRVNRLCPSEMRKDTAHGNGC